MIRLFVLLMYLAREPKKLVAVLVIAAIAFGVVAIASRSDATGFYNSFVAQYRSLDDVRNNTLLPAWDPKNPAAVKPALATAHAEFDKALAAKKDLNEPSDRDALGLYRGYMNYLNDYQVMLGKLDTFSTRTGYDASYSEWAKLVGKDNNNPLDSFDRMRESFAKRHGLD